MKSFRIYSIIIGIVVLGGSQAAISQQQSVTISIIPTPPVSPFLKQVLKSFGPGLSVSVRNSPNSNVNQIFLTGLLKRLTPSPFSIRLRATYKPEVPISLAPGQTKQLLNNEVSYAFGDYDDNTLEFTGITLYDLREGFDYRLPEGMYQICLIAKNFNNPQQNVSPEVCAMFNVCYKAAAPQFMQPVSQFAVSSSIPTVRPDTRIMFTWSQPNATCGGILSALRFINYDFEIREVFNNQTITDAIRNPFIFHKTALNANTFLLDTNLYRNVLQVGKKYVLRVKANMPGSSTILLDNNGYSRIEAFQYGDNNAPSTNAGIAQYTAIPYDEKDATFWINVFKNYEADSKRDTLVPIKEYIPLILTYHGIVYSNDAILMFYELNPDLKSKTHVKLSYKLNLPDFPQVSTSDRSGFESRHAVNLQPDNREEQRFTALLDTLKAITTRHDKPNVPWDTLYSVVDHLNDFRLKADTINRVSMNLINELISALINQLRAYPSVNSNSAFSRLKLIISDLAELTKSFTNETSFLRDVELRKNNFHNGSSFAMNVSMSINDNYHKGSTYDTPDCNQLCKFDVIVGHFNNENPRRLVWDTPELQRAYLIFYQTPGLYDEANLKNNKKILTPASTALESFPPAIFMFCARSTSTLRHTQWEQIDTRRRFAAGKEDWPPEIKNYKILIIVD